MSGGDDRPPPGGGVLWRFILAALFFTWVGLGTGRLLGLA